MVADPPHTHRRVHLARLRRTRAPDTESAPGQPPSLSARLGGGRGPADGGAAPPPRPAGHRYARLLLSPRSERALSEHGQPQHRPAPLRLGPPRAHQRLLANARPRQPRGAGPRGTGVLAGGRRGPPLPRSGEHARLSLRRCLTTSGRRAPPSARARSTTPAGRPAATRHPIQMVASTSSTAHWTTTGYFHAAGRPSTTGARGLRRRSRARVFPRWSSRRLRPTVVGPPPRAPRVGHHLRFADLDRTTLEAGLRGVLDPDTAARAAALGQRMGAEPDGAHESGRMLDDWLVTAQPQTPPRPRRPHNARHLSRRRRKPRTRITDSTR
jgi:hypothetical protein